MAKFVAILMLSLAVVNAQTSTKQCKGEKFSNKKLLLKVGEDHSIILRRKKIKPERVWNNNDHY